MHNLTFQIDRFLLTDKYFFFFLQNLWVKMWIKKLGEIYSTRFICTPILDIQWALSTTSACPCVCLCCSVAGSADKQAEPVLIHTVNLTLEAQSSAPGRAGTRVAAVIFWSSYYLRLAKETRGWTANNRLYSASNCLRIRTFWGLWIGVESIFVYIETLHF